MNKHRRTFVRQSAAALAILPIIQQAAPAAVATAVSGMPEPRYLNVEGVRTRYYEAGNGDPLVLIHGGQFGMDSDTRTWDRIFGLLAAHFRVYAFDKLGQGDTGDPPSDAHWSMAAVIDHAYGFIQALGLTRYHLAGQSRGALPAARIAIDHPEQVERLIIINSNTLAPDNPATPLDYYVKRLAAHPPKSPKWPNAKRKLEELTAKWVTAHPQRVKENPALGMAFSPSPWFVYDLKYETLGLIDKGGIKAPTLIIWGYNDTSAPFQLGVELFDRIAAVTAPTRFYVLNECGHLPHQDHPREVVRLMGDFIEQTSPS